MYKIILFLFLGVSFETYSSVKWINLDRGSFHLTIPKDWNGYKKMFSIPYVVLSPKKNNSRITIAITPTGKKNFKFIKKREKKNYQKYIEGRKKYVEKYKGKIIKFYPYKISKWKNIKQIHTSGFKYKLNDFTFVEKSHYFNCKNQLYHIKTLYRVDDFGNVDKKISKILNTFSCKKL